MQSEPSPRPRSFFDRSNDLAARDLPSRLSRFVRAKLRSWCAAGSAIADDPRVFHAWRRQWDGGHYLQLLRWRNEGFRPLVVYDIGAHEGLWSQMCQEIFAPDKCLLFEPQSEFHAIARGRQPQSGADWELIPVALGDREQMETLHVTQNAAASSLLSPLDLATAVTADTREVRQQKIQVMPLDAVVQSRKLPLPDLVKIDVQGFEGRVLAGGHQTISQAQRVIVEVSLQPLYQGQSLMPEVLQTLVSWGFVLDEINETYRQWPGKLWQVDLWMKRGRQ